MLLRVIGIGLIVLVSIPLIMAFPPLAAAPLIFLFLKSRGASRSPNRRHRSTSRGASGSIVSGTASRRGRPKSARRSSRGYDPAFRKGVAFIIGSLVVFSLLRARFEENPLSTAILIVIGLVSLFVVWRIRRPRRLKAWAGSNGHGNGLPMSTVAAGTEFEWHVVDMLQSLDYRAVQRVGGAGDNGIDIVAETKQGETVLVQCKRFATGNRVGSVDIQKLLGAVVHHGADGGIFVTTSSYTPAAIALASSGRVPIALYDGRDVARLSR